MLKTRIATAVVLMPLVVYLVVWGPRWGVTTLLVVAAAICFDELYRMTMPERTLERRLGTILGTGALVATAVLPTDLWPTVAAILVTAPPCIVLARPHPIDGAALRMGALWGGFVYLVGTFSFVLALVDVPGHLMCAFVVVWAADSGAYFAGRTLGRVKLYPAISPNKTVEGLVGGVLAGIGGAFLMRAWLLDELTVEGCVILGLGGTLLAAVGDLAESAIKRASGAKDSGRLLPGHGGMLDRLDGLIFAAPWFALVLT